MKECRSILGKSAPETGAVSAGEAPEAKEVARCQERLKGVMYIIPKNNPASKGFWVGFFKTEHPTHWQPLPATPRASSETKPGKEER